MATQTVSKVVPSGLTDGVPVAITGSNTTVHTADADALDECWFFLSNNTTGAINVTLVVDGTDVGDIKVPPLKGDVTFPRGSLLVTNSTTVAFRASGTTDIYASGFVNRYEADV